MEASTRPKQEDAGLSTFPSRERAPIPHSAQTFCQGDQGGESRDKSALTLSDALGVDTRAGGTQKGAKNAAGGA